LALKIPTKPTKAMTSMCLRPMLSLEKRMRLAHKQQKSKRFHKTVPAF